MALRVYVDTSVIGAILDIKPAGRKEVAESFIQSVRNAKIEAVFSTLFIEEIDQAGKEKREKILKVVRDLPIEMLEESNESMDLALAYLKAKALPESARNDARHIAIATVNGLGILVSWNFRHMANMRVVLAINSVNLRLGYRTIEIVPPEEVLDYGEMGI